MDEIKINELYLYTVNTGDLYRKVAQPIMDNLAKKIVNGTYDKTKALIAWQRLADQGAVRYDREINDGRGSMMWIPKKEREEVAKLIQEHYEEELNEKAEKLKSEKKTSSRKPIGRYTRASLGDTLKNENEKKKAQALLDYLKEENLVPDSLTIKDVVPVPSIEYGFKVDGKTYLVTNDEENVWMCMDIVSDKLAMKGIDWLPSSLRREFKNEYKKYSQDDNYDGDIDLDIIDALGCGELLAIDKEELDLGDYLYAYLIKDDSKTSSRKPIGRFVRTEKKASVLSRRVLLKRKASIRRRAEKDWFSLEEKVERYLKENGLSPMVKLWEVDYTTVQGTDKDNISYQFTFDKNGNIRMEYMGGAYTFENTNEPITMAQALGEFGLNPSGISENGSKYWFASQENAEDTDCGTGTFDLLEALDWLSFMKEQGNTEVRICVCSEKSDFCEGEITTDDIY